MVRIPNIPKATATNPYGVSAQSVMSDGVENLVELMDVDFNPISDAKPGETWVLVYQPNKSHMFTWVEINSIRSSKGVPFNFKSTKDNG